MKSKILPVILLALILPVAVYLFQAMGRKSPDAAPVATASSMAAFIKHPTPKDIAPFSFANGKGVPLDISHWKGKVVLLNLWATWCAPCRKEMPELAQLQKLLGSNDFEVVAISEDLKGAEASAAFLKDSGAENLALYVDPKMTALNALQSIGLPTTLLIGRDSKEIGRLLGPADWASKDAQDLVKAALAMK